MGTTVEANNINIWYEEFGDRSNETILLIMGANANCMQWDQEFIDRLVANNFHVVRFDNRDVGKSTWFGNCLLYTSPSPRDGLLSRMPSSA